MKIKDATHHINFYSVPTGTQLKDTDFFGQIEYHTIVYST